MKAPGPARKASRRTGRESSRKHELALRKASAVIMRAGRVWTQSGLSGGCIRQYWRPALQGQPGRGCITGRAMASPQTVKADNALSKCREQRDPAEALPAGGPFLPQRLWKLAVVAEPTNQHDVGTIPERVWRQLYIRDMTPQEAADQAADLIAGKVRPAFDRILGKKR
jgi:hypothetical protein